MHFCSRYFSVHWECIQVGHGGNELGCHCIVGVKFKITEKAVSKMQNNIPKCQISRHSLPERSVSINEWQTKKYFLIKKDSGNAKFTCSGP
jgi:hypothetical protein